MKVARLKLPTSSHDIKRTIRELESRLNELRKLQESGFNKTEINSYTINKDAITIHIIAKKEKKTKEKQND